MRQDSGRQHAIHIAICDDLSQDRKKLYELVADYIESRDIRAVISVYRSGEELLESDISSMDLVFLDIYMGKINGMDTAKELLKKNRSVQVVFTTTSPDFAVEAFQIDAFQYLLKPVKKEDLFRILNRFMEGISAMRSITVKIGRTEENIRLGDILYIEANGKRTVFHMKNGDRRDVSESLAQMKERLKDEYFVCPIRWALVPLVEISSIFGTEISLSDGTTIPLSRGKRDEVKEAYASWRWSMMRHAVRERK